MFYGEEVNKKIRKRGRRKAAKPRQFHLARTLNDLYANDVREGQIKIAMPESTAAGTFNKRSAVLEGGRGGSQMIFLSEPSFCIHFGPGL